MRKKSLRTDILDIEIYAIISPDTKQVFVGKIKNPNHYQAYKDHVRLQIQPTREMFSEAANTQIFPAMYLLEHLETTENVAFGHLIAWIKFFLDKGFKVLGQKKNLDYANDLLNENKLFYLSIMDKSLEEITAENRILVSDYEQKTKKKKENKVIPNKISVVVSPREYEEIKRKADHAGLTMSKYCKQVALDGAIVRISFSEYSDEIRAIKRVFREIQLAIYQSGKYFPADLENMQKLIDQVNDNQRRVIRSIEKEFDKLQTK